MSESRICPGCGVEMCVNQHGQPKMQRRTFMWLCPSCQVTRLDAIKDIENPAAFVEAAYKLRGLCNDDDWMEKRSEFVDARAAFDNEGYTGMRRVPLLRIEPKLPRDKLREAGISDPVAFVKAAVKLRSLCNDDDWMGKRSEFVDARAAFDAARGGRT